MRPCWAEAAALEPPQRAAASALSTCRSVGHGHGHGHGLGFKDLNATVGASTSFVSLMHCAEPDR
jgi:hypothetical protein